MIRSLLVIGFLCLVKKGSSQIVQLGTCGSNVTLEENFDIQRFTGIWYETARTNNLAQGRQQCSNIDITVGATASTFIYSSVNDNFQDNTNGNVVVDGSTLRLSLGGDIGDIDFGVLGTDYTNYALLYRCVQLSEIQRSVYIWQLERNPAAVLNSSIIEDTLNDKLDISANQLNEVLRDSDTCLVLPVIELGQPVILPGQCGEINVVQNFAAGNFTGLWHQVASYYTENSIGACARAEYEATPTGTVSVKNSLVDSNGNLITIEGEAVLSSDNSGTLQVTFEIGNVSVTQELLVLATDYDNYAVLLNCEDVTATTKRVISWIASRSRVVATETQEAINDVIDSYVELNNRYFEETLRGDADCFYYPDLVPNTPMVFRGSCELNLRPQADFDLQRYLGTWYEIESYPSSSTSNCNTIVASENQYDLLRFRLTSVNNLALSAMDVLARETDVSGVIDLVSYEDNGVVRMIDSKFVVVATDYHAYALAYTCTQIDDELMQVSSRKLSKNKQLTAADLEAIRIASLDIRMLDDRYYSDVDQSTNACFYYPVADGSTLFFPGVCDNNIQVVQNFELERYMGTWYDIASYPQEFQDGDCPTAEYELTDQGVVVYNTEVVNDRLVTANGLAVPATDDGSGKFTVTFPIPGTDFSASSPYWVLATDYDNYALVYSCVDVDNFHRRVSSWKLSRNQTLSAEHSQIMDAASASIDVLRDDYYIERGHDESSCFYHPEYFGGPVILSGSCPAPDQINAVERFSAFRFADPWYEISRFTSITHNGHRCVSSELTVVGGTLRITQTYVYQDRLVTLVGTATLSNDGRGIMSTTLAGDGINIPVDLYVLDTDYTNYAVIYSCSDVDDNRRQVMSWKLSRTQSGLSTESERAIANLISNTQYLLEEYYIETERDSAACFFLPIPDGNPLVFRGSCDNNIEVVQDFELERYMGTWYDIASYPQFFQDGDCPTANYELTAQGVQVINTEVVNDRLVIANGIATPATDDGSGKFNVFFPIPGIDSTISSPYWVLATDYDNYALVYSCVDIENDQRRVSSWKLSRTQSLLEEYSQIIDNVTEAVPVLRDEYYIERGHDESSCFYLPEYNGGPVILDGRCPAPEQIDAVERFSAFRFAEPWYEIARTPSTTLTGQCVSSEITVFGGTLRITQTYRDQERLVTLIGTATLSTDGRGIISTTLVGGGLSIPVVLYILDTDYTNYAVIYSCTDLANNQRQVMSWKLSRTQSGFNSEAETAIANLISNTRYLLEEYYTETARDVDACYYYPDLGSSPSAIIIPGICDERIQAKANFDPVAYQGVWREIARYPQPFEFGECAQAEYILANGMVDVTNTIVYNQTLETIYGTAVIASTDGSGLLEVTFELEGGTIVNVANYYVMETDYENFALVYSCRNLPGEETHQVSSWKLSRHRTLSNEANAIMDNVIQNTRGLLEDYYTVTSQSDEDCFYIPDKNVDSAVVFRGTCENINGVENFDVDRFAGWWHEIESFPTGSNVGECISSNYQNSDNQLRVVNTNVFGLEGRTDEDVVYANENGRLRRIESNGNIKDIWVLATDYNNYALLYSCVQINSEYRQVWSAKHSKARSFANESQTAIEPYINDNMVLYPQFYDTVDQSDEACFHYPEIQELVILPGRCDSNIPVQNNFDFGQYSGDWFEIQRYPQAGRTGECSGIRHTVNEDDEQVEVVAWNIVNDALQSNSGSVLSIDGSGRLSFNISGANENEWIIKDVYVLTTDYTSYSLIYSCDNVGEYHRQVEVWKLSRTRTLPASANTAINSYMSNRQELHQPYFIDVVQDEDCVVPSSALIIQSSLFIVFIAFLIQIMM